MAVAGLAEGRQGGQVRREVEVGQLVAQQDAQVPGQVVMSVERKTMHEYIMYEYTGSSKKW